MAYKCSKPDCRAQTSGPCEDPEKALNLGVAAHITAAIKNGPRYDPTLTSEQRSHISNGIWLCQNCAKLIDNDPVMFTIELLKEWKIQAENKAFENISKTNKIDLSGMIPDIWNIPLRNPHFTGREKEIFKLHTFLHDGKTTVLSQAITGLGGIGKTQLALEYAHKYKSNYFLIWWINAQNFTTIDVEYRFLAKELGFDVKEDICIEDIIRYMCKTLEYRHNWLLIFDNAIDEGSLYLIMPLMKDPSSLICPGYVPDILLLHPVTDSGQELGNRSMYRYLPGGNL